MSEKNEDWEKRRQSVRVKTEFRVSYPDMDKLLVDYTRNISKGGLFIKTERFLPLNSVIRLHIGLPEGGGQVSCIGKVIYVRGLKDSGPGRPSGLGIEFLDMLEESMQRIEEFISVKSSEAAERSMSAAVQRSLKVLVVDDDKSYRESAAAVFEKRGDKVKMAEDGLEGLAICLKDPPDVILTDVQMPRMDGWDFLRMIRSRPSLASVLVIFQTSLGGEKERLRGYRLGVDDYLAKPYQAEELVARVERLVARTMASHRSAVENKTLRGDLEQVSLPAVLSMLEIERHTGVILVVGDGTARIFIREGRPLAVEIEGAAESRGQMDMMVELLDWKAGQFEFAAQDVSRNDELETSVQGLLMEAARITDEAAR